MTTAVNSNANNTTITTPARELTQALFFTRSPSGQMEMIGITSNTSGSGNRIFVERQFGKGAIVHIGKSKKMVVLDQDGGFEPQPGKKYVVWTTNSSQRPEAARGKGKRHHRKRDNKSVWQKLLDKF